MKLVLDFIPLISVILLSILSNDIKNVWFTPLGKLFAIILILFYSGIDKFIGLAVCIMFVFFYNTYDFHIFEGLENSEEQQEEQEQANLIATSESAMDDFDMDDVVQEASEITGDDIQVSSDENTIVDMENQIMEKQKLEIKEKENAQKFEMEKKQQDLDEKQRQQDAKVTEVQMKESKKRNEIDSLKDILKNRKNYSNSIITKVETRLEELLFDKGTNETDTNNTIKKIETFANLIPKLTRF